MTDYSVPRDSRRVPLATRVQLKFEWFSGFISEYSSNISPGGMFIRTQTPEPVGRLLGFEFRLGDGFELIQGTGEVTWVRPLDESPDKPAGMGLRFLELSPHSRELIARMVENYVRAGGTPFDLADAPAASAPPIAPAVEIPPAVAPTASIAPASEPRAEVAPASERPAEIAPATAPAAVVPVAPVIPPPFRPQADAAPREEVRLPPPIQPPPPAPAPARVREPAAAAAPAARGRDLPWPEAVAATAPAPPIPILESPAALESAAGARPVRMSRIVLWALFAAFLGGAAWMVLTQGLLSDWLTRAGAVAGQPTPPRHPARPRQPTSVAVAAAPGTETAAVTPPAPALAAPSSAPAAPPPVAATSAGSAVAAADAGGAKPSAVPPPPVAEVAAATAAAAAATPLSEIEKITWQQSAEGTEVVLWGNGAFRRQDYSHYRVDGDPPRVLIKVHGIHRPFAEARLVVGTRQVRQVRTGYHDEKGGNELHVVLDLAGFGVEVTGMQEDADRLRIFLKGV